jgi:molybdopterin-guanine dinucleotide biosynthesis protein A
MSVATSFSGVVLAAGRSTRMGRDKALLEIDGLPMWRRQRDVLARAGATEIFLSARTDQEWVRDALAAGGWAGVLHDAMPSAGPLCGLTAAIERASHAHVAVLAIDLPKMNAEWFAGLRRECAPGVGVVGRRGDFFEPLAAIYPRELMPLAWSALAHGRYALQQLVKDGIAQQMLRAREIGAEESALFENRNEA